MAVRPAGPARLARELLRPPVVAPVAVLLHTLFVKRVVFDGRPGLRYAWERFVAEVILSRELLRPAPGERPA